MMLILFLFDVTTRIPLCGERTSKRISRIIGINDEVQTFLRNHEWKVGLTFFVVVWVSVVVSIEKAMLISSVIHSGPRFTASFGQVCANFFIHSHLCALSEKAYRFFPLSQLGFLSSLSIPTRGLGCDVGLLKELHLWLYRIPQICPLWYTITMRTWHT